MKIAPYKFVTVSYQLFAGEGEEEELFEETTPEQPLTYISGVGAMLESFEKNLSELSAGDSFDFVIPVEDAYGEYDDEQVVDLPKSMFEIDGVFDEDGVYEDAIIPMMDAEGNSIQGAVVSVTNDAVMMDFNHPMAGETLHFIGKVEEVRDATDEEIQHALSIVN